MKRSLKDFTDSMSSTMKLGWLKWILLVAIAYMLVGNCWYTVKQKEVAIVTRFGEYVRTVEKPGWNFKWPIIEVVIPIDVSAVNRLEFGFRTAEEGKLGGDATYEADPNESLMITGDEKLIHVEAVVQYQIVSAENYIFEVDDPIGTLRVVAESQIRRGVASRPMDEILTGNKEVIQNEIADDIQEVCEKYMLGVRVRGVNFQDVSPPAEVQASFDDVNKAREEMDGKIEQAQKYYNEKVVPAKGNADKLVNDATGQKEIRVKNAQGDVAEFEQLLVEYQQGKYVTRTRLYLETMEKILKTAELYVARSDGSVVKFLPLGNGFTTPVDKAKP